MTTPRFNRLAGATARAMAEAHQRTKAGSPAGAFPCPSGCGGQVRFTGNPLYPHRTAGSCQTARCIRWAQP